MKIFGQLVAATAKDIIRDKMSLFWFLAFPIIFILLFGTIFSSDKMHTWEVGLVTEGENPFAPAIITGLKAVPAFKLHQGTRAEELAALRKGDRSMVLVIPPAPKAARMLGASSFPVPPPAAQPSAAKDTAADQLKTRKAPETLRLTVYYDPTQQTTKQVMLPVVQHLLEEMERQVTGRPRLFAVSTRPVRQITLKDIDYLLPGILAMALMQLGLFGSLRAVDLREQKIFRSLGATPLPRHLFLAAEVVVRIVMALVQTLAIVFIGYLVFHVQIVGNWLAVFGSVFLGALTFVSLGYMLISFARTEESAMGLIQVVQFPMMFLSGIFFPLKVMPNFLKPVINALPLTYLGDLLRQIMVGAPPAFSWAHDLLVLGCWAVITMLVAVKFWRWE